jgi:hypothetical protein
LPVPHSYTNALDIEAAGTQLGCTPGTTEWARLDKLEGGASGFSFPEHAEDRAISSFTDENNGRTYQNLADRAAQSNGMHVYEVYRRDSPRVRVKLDRIKKNHTFSYHNQEMKDVIESTDANVRATFPDVIGRSLVEMLEEKTLGYFYAGIVTTAEDQAERKDPNATVGTAQINLAAHIKENGSLKSNSAIHSVRSSDYASFMVPAMREFVDRFALSTYKLGLPAGQNVFSVGIKDQEGQVTAVEFTHDKAQASQFVAVLSDGSLQFNLPKLQELLGIQVAAGKQLTDEDLKDYTIVVQTIGE